jgi:hypothetical protein
VSFWGVHVGIAGITTAVVLFVLAPGHRYRGVVIGASGFWAVVPDFHHAMGAFPSLQTWWRATLHDSVVGNVFWFHRWIDLADPGDRILYSVVMWAALVAVVVTTELAIRWRRRRHQWSEPE